MSYVPGWQGSVRITNHTHGFEQPVHKAESYLCIRSPTVTECLSARWHLTTLACSVLLESGLEHTAQVTIKHNPHRLFADAHACMLNVAPARVCCWENQHTAKLSKQGAASDIHSDAD